MTQHSDDIRANKKKLEDDKRARKVRISKLRLAAIGLNPSFGTSGSEARRDLIQKTKSPTAVVSRNRKETQRRLEQEKNFINRGTKINPAGSTIDTRTKKKFAAITKGNTTFSKLTPEDIIDTDDIDKNIKPLKGSKPRRDTDPIPSSKKGTRVSKLKARLALITKGNTTFDSLPPEAIVDEQDIRRNIKPIRGTGPSIKDKPRPRFDKSKKRLKPLTGQQRLAIEHHHAIVFRGHPRGQFKMASLFSQDQKFAKYFLLNAKQINGNGWGISQLTARENMQKFVDRPLVVTSSLWHGASLYGESYEHPYLPTNNLKQIFEHQEQYRVGNIVAIDESSNGDFHAIVELLPKFAGKRLPPFCSPAIFQLDAMEKEGNISKWEALHLAALDSDPAYGARIAILKGTCIGTESSCTVQFKSAKTKRQIRRLSDEELDADIAQLEKSLKEKKAKFVGRPGESKGKLVKRKLGEVLDGTAIMKDGTEKDTANKILNGQIICAKNTKRLRARLAAITAFGKPKKPHTKEDQKSLDKATTGFTQRDLKKKNS